LRINLIFVNTFYPLVSKTLIRMECIFANIICSNKSVELVIIINYLMWFYCPFSLFTIDVHIQARSFCLHNERQLCLNRAIKQDVLFDNLGFNHRIMRVISKAAFICQQIYKFER